MLLASLKRRNVQIKNASPQAENRIKNLSFISYIIRIIVGTNLDLKTLRLLTK